MCRILFSFRLIFFVCQLNAAKPIKLHGVQPAGGNVPEGDIYETVETYSRQQKLGHLNLRNVHGKVPTCKETFIDDGDVDIIRVLRILKKIIIRACSSPTTRRR